MSAGSQSDLIIRDAVAGEGSADSLPGSRGEHGPGPGSVQRQMGGSLGSCGSSGWLASTLAPGGSAGR